MAEAAVKQRRSVKAAGRRLSPEEISVREDPQITVRFTNMEWNREQGGVAPPLSFSWGGIRWNFIEGKEYKVPLGLLNHVRTHCQNPIYTEVPDPDNPPNTKCIKTGLTPRFVLEPINYEEMAKAEAEAAAKNKGNSK